MKNSGSILDARHDCSPAKEHFGEAATVCGEVGSTRYADSTKWQPTFLNLNEPFLNQIFTIVVWGNNRSKFGAPEKDYIANQVCVTGKITSHAGLPKVVAEGPKQIWLETNR